MAKERQALVTNIFTADPSAHVFDGKIYIYPSHDIPHDGEDNDDGDEYRMEDYHVLSLDSLDADCVDNGEALHMKNVPWVGKQMWAPDCAFKNGKYYLYFPARDKEGIFRLGVAVSDSPVGPFVPEDAPIEGSMSIDPAVLVDDDGRVYCYNGGLWGGRLHVHFHHPVWCEKPHIWFGSHESILLPVLIIGSRLGIATDRMPELSEHPAESRIFTDLCLATEMDTHFRTVVASEDLPVIDECHFKAQSGG